MNICAGCAFVVARDASLEPMPVFLESLLPLSSSLSLVCASVCSLIPHAMTHEFVAQYDSRKRTPAHLGISIAIGVTVSAATGYHCIGIFLRLSYAMDDDSVVRVYVWYNRLNTMSVMLVVILPSSSLPIAVRQSIAHIPTPAQTTANNRSENRAK